MAQIQGGSVVWDLDVDSSKFEAGLRDASNSVDELGQQMSSTEAQAGQFSSNLSNAFDTVANGLGRVITGATALAIGGSFGLGAMAKAAYDQVDAVQQASFALKAYDSNATEVNSILGQLVKYAQSDMGVLFQRQDLFKAASNLKGFGDAAGDVVGHVQVLAKGVALGYTNFDELSQIIGRVAQQGTLSSVAFDQLAYRGIILNSSLRGAKISSEDLYKALNKALPDSILQGRANTIQGIIIRLQSAFRGLGQQLLDVDSKTSQFAVGGLGDTLVKGISTLTAALKGPEIKKAFADIGDSLTGFAKEAIPLVISSFTLIVQHIPDIVSGFGALIAMFLATKAAAIGFGIAALVAQGALTWPIVGIVAGVTAIVGALTFLQIRFNFLGQAVKTVQNVVSEVAPFIENRFQRLLQIFQSFGVSFQFGGIRAAFTDLLGFMTYATQRAGQIMDLFIQNTYNRLAGRTAGQDPATFWDALIGAINRLRPILNTLSPVITKLRTSLSLTGEIIRTQIQPAFAALIEVTKPLIKALEPLAKSALKTAFIGLAVAIGVAAGAMLTFTSGLIGGIANALPYVTQALEGLIQFIRGFVQIVTGILTGNWALAWEGAKQSGKGFYDFFFNLLESLGKFITGFVPSFISPFKAELKAGISEALTFIEGKYNSLRNHVETVFAAINKVYEDHKGVINGVVGTITIFFLPAIIKVATQAAISGAILAAQFIVQVVKVGVEAAIATGIMTVQFIGAMLKMATQAVITGAVMATQFIINIVKVGVEAGIAAAVGMAQLIVATVTWGIEGWKTVAMLIVRSVQLAISTGLMVADTIATWAAAAATGAMSAAVWILDAALAVLTSPITLVILAIIALIAIGYLLITHWGQISQAAGNTWNAVATWFNAIRTSVVSAIMGAWAAVTSEVSKWPNQFYNWGSNVAKAFADGFGKLGDWLKDKISSALNAAKAFLKGNSPPVDGPFKDIDQWGFNVGKAWAGGLQAAISQLTLPNMQSTFSLSDPLASSYASAVAAPTSQMQQVAGRGDVHVHVGNLNVQQPTDATDIAKDIAFRIETSPAYIKNG